MNTFDGISEDFSFEGMQRKDLENKLLNSIVQHFSSKTEEKKTHYVRILKGRKVHGLVP